MLGEFEYLILSAATRLGEDAYGAAIRQEIEDATKHGCSIGALYTTLDRLEAKGFIKTRMGDPRRKEVGDPSVWCGLLQWASVRRAISTLQ